MKWTERIGQRNANKEENIPWWVNDKYRLHKWCKENGFPMPELFRFWKTPEEMDLEGLPPQFVLKPSVMHSSQGVMVLHALDDGTYFELIKQKNMSVDQIRAAQKAAFDRCKYKGSYRLLVEEKIESPNDYEPIPRDYKVYTFYDQAHLVQQINRNTTPTSQTFYGENFGPIDLDWAFESDWESRPLDSSMKPSHADEILRIASEATAAIKTPFMRVDMFEGINGPVIGELTASPGGAFYGNEYKYSDEFDQHMGDQWTSAERRIQRDS